MLSNDSFQEFHGEHPWLFEHGRLLGATKVPGVGWIFVARNPVRGPRSQVAVREAARAKKQVAKAIAVATKEVVKPAPLPRAGAKAPPAGKAAAPRAVNDPMTFISFIAEHPLGGEIEAEVETFSSHGAVVHSGGLRAYVPLSGLGEPAPRSARRRPPQRGDTPLRRHRARPVSARGRARAPRRGRRVGTSERRDRCRGREDGEDRRRQVRRADSCGGDPPRRQDPRRQDHEEGASPVAGTAPGPGPGRGDEPAAGEGATARTTEDGGGAPGCRDGTAALPPGEETRRRTTSGRARCREAAKARRRPGRGAATEEDPLMARPPARGPECR